MANPKGNPSTLTSWKSTWRSGRTKTIRVPVALAEQVLELARAIDRGQEVLIDGQLVEGSSPESLPPEVGGLSPQNPSGNTVSEPVTNPRDSSSNSAKVGRRRKKRKRR